MILRRRGREREKSLSEYTLYTSNLVKNAKGYILMRNQTPDIYCCSILYVLGIFFFFFFYRRLPVFLFNGFSNSVFSIVNKQMELYFWCSVFVFEVERRSLQ